MTETTPNLYASVEIEVPFHDVDVMEVCWHGHYVKYLEVARTALLRRLAYDYVEMRDSGYLWPVVECYLKYVGPALYGQRLEVRAELLEYRNRLKIGYTICDGKTGTRLTKGYTVQVAVAAATRELQFVSPAVLLDKVESLWRA